jgi:hypothetical protein
MVFVVRLELVLAKECCLRMHWLIRLYLKSLCSLFDSVYPLPNILVPPVPLISAFNFLVRRSQLRMDNFVTSFLCEYLVSSHSGPTRFQNVVLVFHHPLNLTRIVAQTLRHTEKLSARCHRTLSLNIHAKGYDHDKVGGHIWTPRNNVNQLPKRKRA